MYTYNDFEKAAQQKGLLGEFSAADLALAKSNPDVGMSLLSNKENWHGATTDDERALINAENNALRQSYGNFSGGTTGSDFKLQPKSPASYETPEYTSKYKDQISGLTSGLNSEFSYDPNTDENVAAYKKAYTREGQRATENALGEAASATGGIPSTFATTAAAQAGQYYASQMADKLPELREQAYNEFLQKRTLDMQILDALEQLDQTDRSNYEADRSFDYSKLLNDLDFDANAAATTAAQTEADKSALQARADALASIGDFSLYKQAYGFTDEQVAELKAAWDGQNGSKAKSTSSQYGSPVNDETGTGDKGKGKEDETVDADAVASLVGMNKTDSEKLVMARQAMTAGDINAATYKAIQNKIWIAAGSARRKS